MSAAPELVLGPGRVGSFWRLGSGASGPIRASKAPPGQKGRDLGGTGWARPTRAFLPRLSRGGGGRRGCS